jgi:2-iminobutanoate/2-iminopropanoate deaminase
MSPRRSIDVEGMGHGAPIPMGSRIGNTIYSSGIMGTDRTTGTMPADGETQVRNTFANLVAFMDAADATVGDLIRVSVSLSDNALRSLINEEWLKLFPDAESRPARHISFHESAGPMIIQLEVVAVVEG